MQNVILNYIQYYPHVNEGQEGPGG